MQHAVAVLSALALGAGGASAQTAAPMLLKLPATAASLSPGARAAIFRAAGAQPRGGKWVICADDPRAEPAAIEKIADLNGDGRAEALVTDGGTYCYGNTGAHFALLSQQPNGSWKPIYAETGIAEFKPTRGAGGWPDLEVGGPGFCFPLMRWNGSKYALLHFNEYEKGSCRAAGLSPAVPAK